MQAILLCGGLGTRLRSVVSDRPKPLADVHGRAFMEYLTRELVGQGIRELIFAVGYRGKMVEEYFGDGAGFGFRASYAYEQEPLGTAGAIRNALPYLTEESCYVLNADTFYKIDYRMLSQCMEEGRLDMALLTRTVPDISRYGALRTENGLVTGWNEKSERAAPGEINGGVYLLRCALMESIPEGKQSLENDMIPRWLSGGKRIGARHAEGYFIDIGIPEAYERFREDIAKGRI